jgi:hypothetical protein
MGTAIGFCNKFFWLGFHGSEFRGFWGFKLWGWHVGPLQGPHVVLALLQHHDQGYVLGHVLGSLGLCSGLALGFQGSKVWWFCRGRQCASGLGWVCYSSCYASIDLSRAAGLILTSVLLVRCWHW